MHTLKQQVIDAYIRQNYPDSRIVSWDDENSGLTFYTADQLQQLQGDWFPLCCHKDEATGKAVYGGRDGIVHTYTEGETGAGKTTRFAMQSIRALSSMKDKPSFVVVDIHGELVENLYNHLHDNGYAIRILNCDDPSRSDTYNPFAPLAKRCVESGSIPTEVLNEIRKIAEIMQPIRSDKDPIWEQGARSYTNGCILDKFEDLLVDEIPAHCVTLYNIIENHYWLRRNIPLRMGRGDLLGIPHYKKKGSGALSVQKMLSVTDNADKTQASYFGVVENHYDTFGQPALYQLSSNTTIDINEFIDQPTAIFIQSGSTRIGDDLISLLTNEIYNTVVRLGKLSPTKMLPRKIHCFLDEFANSNIADGPEFIKMLTTSRKFGMYWHLLLQCDAQLDRKFDQNMARIIRANCTEIFMGSQDHETMVRFARSCGQKTVESLTSMISQQGPILTTVDLVTPDRLSLMEQGYVYIKSNRHPLMYSYIEAFYNCPEFVPAEDIRSVYPVNTFDYRTTVFFPDDIVPHITQPEFQLLRHVYERKHERISKLFEIFPMMDVDAVLKRLYELDMLRRGVSDEVAMFNMSEADYERVARQHPNVPKPQLKEEDDPDALIHAIQKTMSEMAEAPALYLLDEFESISRPMKLAFAHLAGQDIPADTLDILRSGAVHYELVRTFIRCNNYPLKKDWVEGFRQEYKMALGIPFFPKEFKLVFARSLKMLKDELTYENIRTIRKAIIDAEEE